MDTFWTIDRKPKGIFVNIVGIFVKNRQDMKK